MTIRRRDFLAASTAAGLAFSAPAILGAEKNKRYRTALVGSGWWGTNILGAAIDAGQSEVVALCDVDSRQLDKCLQFTEKKTGSRPKAYKHYRELLEEQKPEIVIVATPDHWHPLAMIAAVKAGAHVYVEKPISHTINEGKAMVEAARAADRVVQVGTHRRVSPHCINARKFIQDGKLGKIGMIRAFVLSGGGPGSPTPASEPPAELDWDMWCGPAPKQPFRTSIHPKGFRQYLDYANGTMGDWGIHWFDQILWIMEQPYPTRVYSTGGRFIKQDSSTAPDTQLASFDFDGFRVDWEQRQYGGNAAEKHSIGCYFYGTEGMLHLGWRDGWTFYPLNKNKSPVHEEPTLHEPDNQNIPELWADFLDAIATKRRPVCDIEIGHRSTTVSLLGMLSWKLGRSVDWDGEKQVIVGDDEANKLLARPYREPWEYPV